jgi:dihydrofolate synthase/folylpolyglutamate synthase
MIQHQTPPTFFEVITAMAFLYFRNHHVDYAVIEVGLGGRFDATNVVTPLVSVITNISLEHTNILGNDLASIAFEKAGIIKQHVPVVTAAIKTARGVIEMVALERESSVTIVEKKAWKRLSHSIRHQEFSLRGSLKEYTVRTSLLGLHQGENLAVSIAAIEQLQLAGVYITDHDIVDGIAKTVHPGHMELVAEDPLILLDGAHNPDAMDHLVQTLKEFTYERLILVLGILRDKDVDLMLASIVPRADVVLVTKSMNARASEPVLLKEKIERLIPGKTVFLEETVSQAVAHAQKIAKPKDLICISGSLFTVGEARSYLSQHGRKKHFSFRNIK